MYLQSTMVCMMEKARVDYGSVSFGLSLSKPMKRLLTVEEINFYQKKKFKICNCIFTGQAGMERLKWLQRSPFKSPE